jgi:hypothetical protein
MVVERVPGAFGARFGECTRPRVQFSASSPEILFRQAPLAPTAHFQSQSQAPLEVCGCFKIERRKRGSPGRYFRSPRRLRCRMVLDEPHLQRCLWSSDTIPGAFAPGCATNPHGWHSVATVPPPSRVLAILPASERRRLVPTGDGIAASLNHQLRPEAAFTHPSRCLWP